MLLRWVKPVLMLAVGLRQELEGSHAIQQRLHPPEGDLGWKNSQYVSVCSFTSNAAFDGVLSARRRVTVSWQLCCQVKCLALRGDLYSYVWF